MLNIETLKISNMDGSTSMDFWPCHESLLDVNNIFYYTKVSLDGVPPQQLSNVVECRHALLWLMWEFQEVDCWSCGVSGGDILKFLGKREQWFWGSYLVYARRNAIKHDRGRAQKVCPWTCLS